MLRMTLMGLGALSPPDEAIWWLAPGGRDSWPVVVAAGPLHPDVNVRTDDTRHYYYWSKSFYDSVAASLAAIGRSLATQPPPDKSQISEDAWPPLLSLGKAADVRTAIQLALANPLKPSAPAPAPAPVPTSPVPQASVPAPAVTPTNPAVPTAPAPTTQVTPASAASAIVQSGNPAPVQAVQASATTAITPPSSALRWVLLGVLALGGAGAGTYYFIKKRKAVKNA